MVSPVVFSSRRQDWETPRLIFDKLNDEFYFDLDPAASETNAKCKNFFTQSQNGLIQPWYDEEKQIISVFVNPPYGRNTTGKWVKKAYEETVRGALVVMLLPARTDTKWFHQYILPFSKDNSGIISTEIRFIKGRVQFELDGKPVLDKKNHPMRAPFPSMVVVFKNSETTDK